MLVAAALLINLLPPRRTLTMAAMGRARGATASISVRLWLTTADGRLRVSPQPSLHFTAIPSSGTFRVAPSVTSPRVLIDERQMAQQIDGFGAALTDSSAWLIETHLAPEARHSLLTRLFSPSNGIGLSVVRLPMGASDFIKDGAPYSYDDLPPGMEDPTLVHFSTAHDETYIIPLLQEIQGINPQLKIIASPWSPPPWMKTNNFPFRGRLVPGGETLLATYFVRFIEAYAAHGLAIYAVTPQNEPVIQQDYPSMELSSEREATFIRAYLGPAFAAAGLKTKILGYDMNWGLPSPAYPFALLSDGRTTPYMSGTAYHCYQGDPSVMSLVHELFPTQDVYETECSMGIAPLSAISLVIADARNWSRTTLLWNIALDPRGGPKIGSGCSGCRPLVTIEDDGTVQYGSDLDGLAHGSQFVPPGAVRIASTEGGRIVNVAFRDPDGRLVLLAHNEGARTTLLRVDWHGLSCRYPLLPGETATLVWRPPSRMMPAI